MIQCHQLAILYTYIFLVAVADSMLLCNLASYCQHYENSGMHTDILTRIANYVCYVFTITISIKCRTSGQTQGEELFFGWGIVKYGLSMNKQLNYISQSTNGWCSIGISTMGWQLPQIQVPFIKWTWKYDPVLAGSLGIWVARLDKNLFEVLIEV